MAVSLDAAKSLIQQLSWRLACMRLDCWEGFQLPTIESEKVKDAAIEFYQCRAPTEAAKSDFVKCCVLNQWFPRDEVRAAYIVAQETDGTTMHHFGLSKESIEDPRNAIVMLNPIKDMFDKKQICFLYDVPQRELRVKVLNPKCLTRNLRTKEFVYYPFKFGDIDGKVLQLPPGVFPFRRCLSLHAKLSFSWALEMESIASDATFEPYYNASDDGLEEPLGIQSLTWQELHNSIHGTSD